LNFFRFFFVEEINSKKYKMQPKKAISSIMDMAKWKKSKAYSDYINFIKQLNESVKGKSFDRIQENNSPVIHPFNYLIFANN
jgi:hypothetical protein